MGMNFLTFGASFATAKLDGTAAIRTANRLRKKGQHVNVDVLELRESQTSSGKDDSHFPKAKAKIKKAIVHTGSEAGKFKKLTAQIESTMRRLDRIYDVLDAPESPTGTPPMAEEHLQALEKLRERLVKELVQHQKQLAQLRAQATSPERLLSKERQRKETIKNRTTLRYQQSHPSSQKR